MGFGAIVGGIASSAVGAAGEYFAGRDSQKRQFKLNRRERLEGPGWDVRGLRNAGLNPILAYGKGHSSSGVGGFSVRPHDIAGQVEKFSASSAKDAQKEVSNEVVKTEQKKQELLDKQIDKTHWESSSASSQAFRDQLLAKAYNNPLVQKTAPIMRAYSESGLPVSSAFQLFKLLKFLK